MSQKIRAHNARTTSTSCPSPIRWGFLDTEPEVNSCASDLLRHVLGRHLYRSEGGRTAQKLRRGSSWSLFSGWSHGISGARITPQSCPLWGKEARFLYSLINRPLAIRHPWGRVHNTWAFSDSFSRGQFTLGECSGEPASQWSPSSSGLGTPVQSRGSGQGMHRGSYSIQAHNLTYLYHLPLVAEPLSVPHPWIQASLSVWTITTALITWVNSSSTVSLLYLISSQTVGTIHSSQDLWCLVHRRKLAWTKVLGSLAVLGVGNFNHVGKSLKGRAFHPSNQIAQRTNLSSPFRSGLDPWPPFAKFHSWHVGRQRLQHWGPLRAPQQRAPQRAPPATILRINN